MLKHRRNFQRKIFHLNQAGYLNILNILGQGPLVPITPVTLNFLHRAHEGTCNKETN